MSPTRRRVRRSLTDSDPGPRPLGEAIEAVVGGLGGVGAVGLARLFRCWEAAVGPTIAAHARPMALRDGTLVVAVDEPGWATQLRYLGTDITAKVNAAVEGLTVERLELRVRPLPPR